MKSIISTRNNWILCTIIGLFGILYCVISFSNHYFFRTFWADYAIYNNAFYDFAHFRINRNPLFEPPLNNFFQVHMSFTLVALTPFYWLFGWLLGTYTLLFVQVLFLLLGGYGVYLLIKLKSNNFLLAILAMFHYFILWGHYSCLAADYIDCTVAASVVPLFIYFFEKRRFVLASLCFVFIIIAKENMPLFLIFISLFLIFIHRKEKKLVLINVCYIGIALSYFLFCFYYLIPLLEDPNRPYWGFAYSALGTNIKDAFLFLITHPVKSFLLLFQNHNDNVGYDGIKAEFYYVALLSGGIFLVCRPKYLILFIPIVAQKMYNDNFLRWGINSFYSIEVVSILSIAVFLAIQEFKNQTLKNFFAIALCLSTTAITLVKLDHRTSLWYDSTKEKFYDKKMYQTDFDVRKVNEHFKIIPDDAAVCSSENLTSHFAFRSHIHAFPFVRESDYIVLLFDHSTYPLTKEQFELEKNKYLSDKNWTKLVDDYPLLILKKYNGI